MIDNGFVLVFCAVLTGMYIFGTIFDTRNKKEWSEIIFNDFFVFGFFGIVGLLLFIGYLFVRS